MNITIRQETEADYAAVTDVILSAYQDVSYSNKREHHMVNRLRKSPAFIPELSLVAEDENNNIVGHILFTRIQIQNEKSSYEGLALAPLSVKREDQKKGIGSRLILKSRAIAEKLGYNFIVVIGHADYYPKFGYELMSQYNIQIPISVADANCMVIQLRPDGLVGVTGMVKYAEEFFE